jgi:hypothetical protein
LNAFFRVFVVDIFFLGFLDFFVELVVNGFLLVDALTGELELVDGLLLVELVNEFLLVLVDKLIVELVNGFLLVELVNEFLLVQLLVDELIVDLELVNEFLLVLVVDKLIVELVNGFLLVELVDDAFFDAVSLLTFRLEE